MKIFVTGGTGFIGQHIFEALDSENNQVYALSRAQRDDPRIQWIQGDLHKFDEINCILKEIQPDILIHLAWYVDPKDYINSLENINCLKDSQNLFENFLDNGGKKIICTGTCFEYDLSYGYLSETDTPTASNYLYSDSKNILRLYLETLSKVYNTEYIWARLFYVYGPNEASSRLVPTIIRSIINNQIAECSIGLQLRDYMYVKDVAIILNQLITENVNGTINVSTGYPVTIREIGSMVEKILNVKNQINYGAFTPREGEPHLVMGAPITNILKGTMELTSLETGIRETVDWWRNYELSNM